MTVSLPWKTASVVGIGVSNRPLIHFLVNHGVSVVARDKKNREALSDLAQELEDLGVRLIFGEDYLKDFKEEVIFRSPGIRFDIPELQKAVADGAVLTGEMELFLQLTPATVIGITGSDGKTTTTTLTALLLKQAGKKVYLGGNIGTPLLPYVEQMTKDDFAVVELSSFQLHNMKISPRISAITNLSPNHLDYHRGMEEYVRAKTNIYLHEPNRRVILNAHDARSLALAESVPNGRDVVWFNHPDGIEYRDEAIYLHGTRILSRDGIILPGRHNVDNYMTAVLLTEGFVSCEDIRAVASTFRGVEHRLELVREKDGVRFYNSSIDSSPSRTAAALSCFSEPVIVICGGYDKHIPFAPLAESLCRHAKKVILTGATAEAIYQSLQTYLAQHPDITPPEVRTVPDFDGAVKTAAACADPGDTVLLSPACASFDAFPNFMERGKRFRELIADL